jgi:hypothetical protein
MALGIPEAIAEVAKLLSKTFGYATDPNGFAQLKLESQLKTMMRAADDAIAKDDWDTYNGLMRLYGELCKQST